MIREINNNIAAFITGGTGSNSSEACTCYKLDYLLPVAIDVLSVAGGTATFVSAILSCFNVDQFPADIQRRRVLAFGLSAGGVSLLAELVVSAIQYGKQ